MIRDRCAVLPSYVAQSSEVIIISPLLYGGFSSNVKTVLDLSIGYISPFFRMVNGEISHGSSISLPPIWVGGQQPGKQG